MLSNRIFRIVTKDSHEVELVSVVHTKLGQSSIWVQPIFTLKRNNKKVLVGWQKPHQVRVDVLEDWLGFSRILDKTLHRVSDKSIGEHVSDVVKVLWDNVGGSAKVKFSQLIGLITI